MPPKDKMQQHIAKLKTALKQAKAGQKKLLSAGKKVQDVQKESKRLVKR
jgi:hypothetical protein